MMEDDSESEESVSEYLQQSFESTGQRSENYRLRHEFLGGRLQSYSDAVFAIVGTVLSVYFQDKLFELEEIEEGGNTLQQFIFRNVPQTFVYHFTFLYVNIIWLNHVQVFCVIERVDDVLIWLNFTFFFVLSFIPLAFGFLSKAGHNFYGILFSSLQIIAVNLVMLVIVQYGTRKKRFIHTNLSNDRHKHFMRAMTVNLLLAPVFSIVTIATGNFNFVVGSVFFGLSIAALLLPRVAMSLAGNLLTRCIDLRTIREFSFHTSKERVELFTDGVYSIVSTLLVLDITTNGIPDDVATWSFDKDIHRYLFKYSVYLATFVLINLFWFVDHSMFHFIKTLTPSMLLVHQCSLSIIGILPPCIKLLEEFHNRTLANSSANESTAMQAVGFSVISIGSLQFLLLALMYCVNRKNIHSTLLLSEASKHLVCKVLILPFCGFIAYSLSFVHAGALSVAVLFLCSPILFVVLSVAMRTQCLQVFCWRCFHRTSRLPIQSDSPDSASHDADNT